MASEMIGPRDKPWSEILSELEATQLSASEWCEVFDAPRVHIDAELMRRGLGTGDFRALLLDSQREIALSAGPQGAD